MELENDRELIMRAARMYYQYNMTQSEVAKELYLSRTKVSRLLKEARDTGVVEIYINEGRKRNSFLEKLFCKNFDLKEAVIFANLPENEDEAFSDLAKGAAEYLDTILKEDSIIGISRGRMMQAIVDNMHPGRKLPVKVVQLIGLMNNPHQNEEEMDLVRKFAKAYGGTYHNLFAPFVLTDQEDREVLNRVAAVGKTINLAAEADIILTSIGKVDLSDKNTLWNSYLTKDDKERLRKSGAVGLFCGRYFDIDGNLIETQLNSKIFGLDVDEITKKDSVIGVSLGKEKVKPILGALRGKFVNILVTDELTAMNVLIQEGRML